MPFTRKAWTFSCLEKLAWQACNHENHIQNMPKLHKSMLLIQQIILTRVDRCISHGAAECLQKYPPNHACHNGKNPTFLLKYTTQLTYGDTNSFLQHRKTKHLHLPCITKAMQKYHLKQAQVWFRSITIKSKQQFFELPLIRHEFGGVNSPPL